MSNSVDPFQIFLKNTTFFITLCIRYEKISGGWKLIVYVYTVKTSAIVVKTSGRKGEETLLQLTTRIYVQAYNWSYCKIAIRHGSCRWLALFKHRSNCTTELFQKITSTLAPQHLGLCDSDMYKLRTDSLIDMEKWLMLMSYFRLQMATLHDNLSK